MKSTTSIALLALAAGLAAFVLFFEKDSLGTRESITSPPVSFDPKDASLISISRGAENFSLRNDGGRWLITLPFEDRANQEMCRDLLESLNDVAVLETINSSEIAKGSPKLEEIDLTPGGGTLITVFGGDGPLASLRVGRRGAFENSCYAAFPSNDRFPEIYVLDSDLADIAARSFVELRDPKLFRMSHEDVGRLVLSEGGKETFEIYRDPRTTLWTFSKPFSGRADQDALDELVKALCSLEIESFIDSTAAPPDSELTARSLALWPVPEGFASFVPLVEVGRGPAGRIQLDLSAPRPPTDSGKPAILGRISERDVTFRLPEAISEIFEADPANLRDRFLAQLPDRSIRGIVISSQGGPDVMLSSNGKIWRSLRNGEWEAAHSIGIERLLDALNEEPVLDHITPPEAQRALKPYGLDPPAVRIGLTTSTVGATPGFDDESDSAAQDESLLERYSLSYVLGLGSVLEGDTPGNPRLHAKFASEPEVLLIDPSFLSRVPIHPLKWKNRRVLGFNIVSLREISIRGAAPDAPAIRLAYDLTHGEWALFIGEENLTPRLDLRKARALSDRLGSLRARDWLANREAGLRALANPSLTVEILLSNPSADGSRDVEETAILQFAPVSGTENLGEQLHFGRLENSTEIFLIDTTVVDFLRAPLLKAE